MTNDQNVWLFNRVNLFANLIFHTAPLLIVGGSLCHNFSLAVTHVSYQRNSYHESDSMSEVEIAENARPLQTPAVGIVYTLPIPCQARSMWLDKDQKIGVVLARMLLLLDAADTRLVWAHDDKQVFGI